MAESEDKSQKTEEPTQKKLDDARKKGQVASSREVNTWFILLTGTIILLLAPLAMDRMGNILSRFLSQSHALPVDGPGVMRLGATTMLEMGAVMAPAFLAFMVAAVAAGVVQNGFLLTADKIQPKLENISLLKGVKRMFSLRSIVEFGKGILKMAIVGAVAFALIEPEVERISTAISMAPPDILRLVWSLALRMIAGVVAVITIIAGVDFLYQKFEFQKSMRMSRQDIKDEMKQTEGDPIIKSRLRQLRIERSRKRMMAAVPEADVVIANPTHYAVALKYTSGEMAAPVVVAKGVDHIALRIREVAKESDVPIVENPPLARALHGGVEIDQAIPETYYRAVAEVIGYVWRLKGKRRAAPAR